MPLIHPLESHLLGGYHRQHNGQPKRDVAGAFDHDDRDTQCHPHNAAQKCGRADQSVFPGLYE